jgi:pyruvate-ferredoxin/flavodoxin oxidoreductase
MDRFAALTGRQYHLYDYVGAPDAERVIVMMGSGAETVEETIEYLVGQGEKLGLVKVRLYRPFASEQFLAALPATVKAIAVLDRTKEPGSAGEPLYLDVVTAVAEGVAGGQTAFPGMPRIIGGRYGLSSKEFTPAMVKAIYDELAKPKPKNHFTVGIIDDVTHTSLDFDPSFNTEAPDVVRAIFWGLGSDGTVSANKNSIKIIGEETDNFAQGYFVYDSKKSGARTISHLRFGPRPIHSTYLINRANFVGVHQFGFLHIYDVLAEAIPGATLLLNAPYGPEEVWSKLPRPVQTGIIEKQLRLYTIDAVAVAQNLGLANRINTIMQTCFFAISGVLPRDEAILQIKKAIRKSYGKRGESVVQKNFAAVDGTLENLYEIAVPAQVTSTVELPPTVSPLAPDFVQKVTAPMIAGRGDLLPVSALPVDGTYPSSTTQWEKRNIAQEVPIWEPDLCIQCGKCVFVCPHAVIRAKVVSEAELADAPEGFKSSPARWREFPDQLYTLQVAVEDCTGCTLCVEACPVKDKSAVGRKAINMAPQLPVREEGRKFWEYFDNLPDYHGDSDDGVLLKNNQIKNVQLLEPLFEFSLACAGCGETPYLKLISQLFGDRAIIANATGCSSIYGGNLPTTPWATNDAGRGPAWANSLFEDNAEFGLGMRLTLDKQAETAVLLLQSLSSEIGAELVEALIANEQADDTAIAQQRKLVAQLKERLATLDTPMARDLASIADMLVKKSVWIVGGDGWAYDIGFGGLDHVIASGRNVNILVMDTEVYSNTGGQSSKATPIAAVAKFAAGGKATAKKDLGLMAMSYSNVYVAHIAMGANDRHTLQAFLEAESYPGPSLIIAYSHCIAHGINMAKGLEQQALATQSGHWPLYRFDPRLAEEGKNPFQLDSKEPSIPLKEYAYNENRYRILEQSNPVVAAQLMDEAQEAVKERWKKYEELAHPSKTA